MQFSNIFLQNKNLLFLFLFYAFILYIYHFAFERVLGELFCDITLSYVECNIKSRGFMSSPCLKFKVKTFVLDLGKVYDLRLLVF